MDIIESQINPKSAEFKANQAHHQGPGSRTEGTTGSSQAWWFRESPPATSGTR